MQIPPVLDRRLPLVRFLDRFFLFMILCLPFERAFVRDGGGAFLQFFVIAFAIMTIPVWYMYYLKWCKGIVLYACFLAVGTFSDFRTAGLLHLPFFGLALRVWIAFYFMLVAYNVSLRGIINVKRIVTCLLIMSITISVMQLLGVGVKEFTEGGVSGSRSEVLGADLNQTSRDVAVFLIYGFLLFVNDIKVETLKKWFLIGLSVLSFVSLIKTGSRGGLVALVGALPFVVFTTRSFSKKIALTIACVFALACIVIVAVNTPIIMERFEKTLHSGDTGGREVIFEITMHVWSQSKAIGRGCFGHMFIMGPYIGWPRLATHCTYTYALVAGGIIGGFFYYLSLIVIVYNAVRARFNPYGAFVMLCLIMVLFGGLTLNIELSKWLYVIYGVALALPRLISQYERNPELAYVLR